MLNCKLPLRVVEYILRFSAVARCQILGGHTVNRDVGYGVHSYINLKILGGHIPMCPLYKYSPVFGIDWEKKIFQQCK